MFVANHNSFMDIPFVGTSLGWRNYKMISKVELGKVPILGRSIKVGGHVMVDRSSRRSQLNTLKSGMKWLKVCFNATTTTTKHVQLEQNKIVPKILILISSLLYFIL